MKLPQFRENPLGTLGRWAVVAVLLSGVWISAQVFLKNHRPTDLPYLLGVAGFCLVCIALVLLRRIRWLLILSLLILGILATITLVRTGAWRVVPGYLTLMLAAISGGSLLFRPRPARSGTLEQLTLSAVFGLGILMVVGTALGLLKGFTQWLVIVILVLIILASLPTLFRSNKNLAQRAIKLISIGEENRHLQLLLAAIAIFIIFNWFWAVSPALRYDAQSYHVSAPNIYIANQGLVEIEESAQTYASHYVEMLYTLALLLGDQPIPNWLHLSAGVLCALLLFVFCRRIWDDRVALYASLLWLSIPIVSIESSTPNIDIFTVLFCLACLLALVIWHQEGQKRFLWYAGFFGGLALGIKISSFPVLISTAICLFVLVILQKRLSALRDILIRWGLPILLLAAPWFVLSWIWTGNPIFPNYNHFFHSPEWVEDTFFTAEIDRVMQSRFLSLPLDLAVNSNRFYHQAPGGALSAVSLLAIPWTLSLFDRRERTIDWLLLGFAILTFVGFGVSALNARYFLPVFPILCALSGVNLSKLGSSPGNSVVGRIFLPTLLAIYLFGTWIPTIVRYWEIPERFPIRYAFGLETREQLLKRAIPEYPLYQYLARKGDRGNVLGLGTEGRLYLNNKVYGSLFSLAGQLMRRATDAEQIHTILKRFDIRYVLVYPAAIQAAPQYYQIPLMDWAFYRDHCPVLTANDGLFLCEYTSSSISPVIAVNLLQNPKFDRLDSIGKPVDWIVAGDPEQLIEETRQAVRLYSPNPADRYRYIYQDVPVVGDQLYSAFYQARLSDGAGNLQMQLEWFDNAHNRIGVAQSWQSLSNDWNVVGFFAVAPSSAVTARFYAAITSTTPEPTTALVDDLCFSPENGCLYVYENIQ